jgi:cytochrome c oxidase subunit 4
VSETDSGSQHEAAGAMGDPHDEAAHDGHPSNREYVRIGLILIVLTATEITVSYSHVRSAILIPTLLVLAFIKFVLVVLWFMHLKFDDRRYARFFVMGLALAFTLFLIVLISFRVFLR